MMLRRASIWAGCIVGLCALLYFVYPPFRYSTWVAAGRSAVCPWNQAVQVEAHTANLMGVKDRILKASHLVRTDGPLELWETPKGQYWVPAGNRYVLPFNLAEMEEQIYGSGETFIHAGDIVLDCGASDGDFTKEALKSGAKLVVSVEVSPNSVECIRRNLRREIEQGRVIVYPKGVWDKDDVLQLRVSDTNFAANSVALRPEGSHTDVQVPLTTVDKLVEELKLPRVDFIKMDIEGAEVKALSGARNAIAKYKPRISIAAEHKPDDEVTIPAAIHQIRQDYRLRCGPCSASEGRIRPDILYFY